MTEPTDQTHALEKAPESKVTKKYFISQNSIETLSTKIGYATCAVGGILFIGGIVPFMVGMALIVGGYVIAEA